jgi:Tfp pilus assembly protein PilF
MKRLSIVIVFLCLSLGGMACNSQSPTSETVISAEPLYCAQAYLNRGDALASAEAYDRAIQLQPDYPQAYINRASAYLRLGRIDLALADFRRGGKDPTGLMILLGVCLVLIIVVLWWVILRFRRKTRKIIL